MAACEIIRWAAVGLFAYSIVSTAWLFQLILRALWNAPDAERRDELLT